MAIPEQQLDVWAKQGSITQSKDTYASIKSCLEANESPFAEKSKSIFLQGSYGNDTNIYADSDVDVVISTESIYYDDTSDLSETERASYASAFIKGGFSYGDFKNQVSNHLINKFGSSVKPGNKAIFIEGSGNRRDADVLPAVEFRRYRKFNSQTDNSYDTGICFWTTDGTKIVNYPKQHSANCTAKHQSASGWYKPSVRILKNSRNSMIAGGYLSEGIAPSYFLEGMLYNAPTYLFGKSYAETIANTINWIMKSDRSKLLCANEQYYLLNPTSPVTWRAENLQTYLDAFSKFWNEW
ncbi:nucleotidyltransferase [Polymorphobacter arshaanensis]|uniref:Nucleotidyltransferase n=1 Tax=Glacieibacterium arshaanense TaxID=2511025 RepID=A0A4Y9ES61_9SPHN|nr:nucleotidyltransferase [Polymorphobacter arshaanensis]TFU06190.1 nucleotidyltransferase [Polymorphobacter arshaanensis]